MREQTLLTPEWVAQKQSFLDWDTQPSSTKHYPHFCYRVALSDHPSLQWLMETRKITDEHLVAQKPYRRLNVPSAGNLHPIEIYVQIRNVAGILSGIYHLDILSKELVMIREIAREGIEPYVGMESRFSGVIVMLSLVPFRSYWKYTLRAWRYLYLDLGHQIGVLGASIRHYGLTLTKMSPIEGLNRVMGMGEDEFIAAVYGVGEISGRIVNPIKDPLMYVQPTDYTEPMDLLVRSMKTIAPYVKIPTTPVWENFDVINNTRRSAREFNPELIEESHIRKILEIEKPDSLEIIPILFQAHTMQHGVYRNGKCAVSENFISEVVYLLLNQRFISGSNMVVLIYAEDFCAESHIEAGIYAQELYTVCEHHTMGCSGIGAFYDLEASRWSDKALLYAVAIGGKV